MAFSNELPIVLIVLITLMSTAVLSLPSLGTCKIETNELSGLTRTICNAGEDLPYREFQEAGSSYKPTHLVRTVKPVSTYYTQRVNLPSTVKVGADATLRKRLCPDGRTPIMAMDPNPGGSASRIVQCISGTTISVGQEAPTFLQRNTRLARWASLRDPYIYSQKTNRPFAKNY